MTTTGIKHCVLETVTVNNNATFADVVVSNATADLVRANNILSIPPETNLNLQDTINVTTTDTTANDIYVDKISSTAGTVTIQDTSSVDKFVFDTAIGQLTAVEIDSNLYNSGVCNIVGSSNLVALNSAAVCNPAAYGVYSANYGVITFTGINIENGGMLGGVLTGGGNILLVIASTATITKTGFYIMTGSATGMADSGLSSFAGISMTRNGPEYVSEFLTHPVSDVTTDPVIHFTYCDMLTAGDTFEFLSLGTPLAFTGATVTFTFFKVQ